jgi:hypothetical protein
MDLTRIAGLALYSSGTRPNPTTPPTHLSVKMQSVIHDSPIDSVLTSSGPSHSTQSGTCRRAEHVMYCQSARSRGSCRRGRGARRRRSCLESWGTVASSRCSLARLLLPLRNGCELLHRQVRARTDSSRWAFNWTIQTSPHVSQTSCHHPECVICHWRRPSIDSSGSLRILEWYRTSRLPQPAAEAIFTRKCEDSFSHHVQVGIPRNLTPQRACEPAHLNPAVAGFAGLWVY